MHLIFFVQRDPSIELDVTNKHGSLSFEHSDNEYESTLGVEWSKGNVGKKKTTGFLSLITTNFNRKLNSEITILQEVIAFFGSFVAVKNF